MYKARREPDNQRNTFSASDDLIRMQPYITVFADASYMNI